MTATKTDEIHVDDIGTSIEGTIKRDGVIVDISTASVKNIIITRPDSTKTTYAGVFKTDGTDGILTYITVLGDLPIPGEYQLQAELTLTTWSGKSSIGKFDVVGNL